MDIVRECFFSVFFSVRSSVVISVFFSVVKFYIIKRIVCFFYFEFSLFKDGVFSRNIFLCEFVLF